MLPLSVQPSLIGLKTLRLRLQSFPGRPGLQDRLCLREDLVKELQRSRPKNRLKFQPVSLLQPGSNLKNPFAAVSISHCPTLAGFAFSFDGNICLGLDLEMTNRLKTRTLARVSSEEEIQSAPDLPVLLWTAKEAAFKCIAPADKNFKLLRDIFVSKWRRTAEGAWLFRFRACFPSRFQEKGRAAGQARRGPKDSGLPFRPFGGAPVLKDSSLSLPGRALPEKARRRQQTGAGESAAEGLGAVFLLKRHAAALAALALPL